MKKKHFPRPPANSPFAFPSPSFRAPLVSLSRFFRVPFAFLSRPFRAPFASLSRFFRVPFVFFFVFLFLVTGTGLGRGVSVPAETSTSPSLPQTFELGGQRLTYAGERPLAVEPGVFWDTTPATAQTALLADSAGERLLVWPGPADEVRLIVQLAGDPLAAAAAPQRQAHRATLQAEHTAALDSLRAQGLLLGIQHQFFTAYNGLAIRARAGDREKILQIPGVRAVYPDYQVTALLPQSVPLIGAPAVWALHDGGGLPVTGNGVRVAVVDSGIDYNHPDLGGPGFPNSRIITGYNFIADTPDPWDDYAHGTHMAGTIGAAGGVTGVAPATRLMAYKIFDAQGKGTTSDILAAIELSLDPDGDPGTQDGAQVINLSLGDSGYPQDPISQACDNAVLAGAVVVAAAGNSGPRYGSLLSPGVARLPISVGATNKSDGLWSGSSRGPVPATWEIKPDLVAPGVSISATIPGGYAYGTGTSSAAAHVSGAAALLRQLHPAWSPQWIKAALMNTAKDVGRSPFEQGAGRLQVDKAALTPLLILPASLSLGRVDASQALWTRAETLALHNTGTATLTYTLSVAGSFPAGITLALSPTLAAIPSGGAISVAFTVSVDTAAVPDAPNDPFAYWGAVLAAPADAAAPPLRVPFAFVKAALLRLHVDTADVSAMILQTDPLLSRYTTPISTTNDYLLPAAGYEVTVQYHDPYAYVLTATTLAPSGFAEINLPRSAALYQARLAFTDESGQPATPNTGLQRLMRAGNGWLVGESNAGGPLAESVSFSAFPPAYVWERSVAQADVSNGAYRQWHGRFAGISSDLEFLTTPADFTRLAYTLRGPAGGLYDAYELFGYASTGFSYTAGPSLPPVAAPYTRTAYYRAVPQNHALYSLRYVFPHPLPGTQAGAWMSPWLQLDGEGWLRWGLPSNPGSTYYETQATTAPWGLGPAHFFARFAAERADRIRLVPAQGNRLYFRASQGGDVSLEKRQPYELRQGDTLIASGDLGSALGTGQGFIALPVSGTYSLTLPFTYTLGADFVGQGRATASFDTSRYPADVDPPYLSVLRLLENGEPADVPGAAPTLHLAVSDGVDIAPEVNVAYNLGSGWLPLAVTYSAGEYVATLPAFPPGTAVSLRITLADASGNTLTHYLEPAYLQGHKLYLPLAMKGP